MSFIHSAKISALSTLYEVLSVEAVYTLALSFVYWVASSALTLLDWFATLLRFKFDDLLFVSMVALSFFQASIAVKMSALFTCTFDQSSV